MVVVARMGGAFAGRALNDAGVPAARAPTQPSAMPWACFDSRDLGMGERVRVCAWGVKEFLCGGWFLCKAFSVLFFFSPFPHFVRPPGSASRPA
jgi:hypothetical protein